MSYRATATLQFIGLVALILLFGVILFGGWNLAVEGGKRDAEEFAFMRSCVKDQSEKRCRELWRYR